MTRTPRKPAWWAALIPFGALVAAIVCVIRFFGSDSLSGASQVALLFAAAVVVTISMAVYHTPWKVLEEAVAENIRSIGTALLILFLIGGISGTWMVSGIVPTLIYYGMQVITPRIFLFAACIICALVSVMTGSSWTTIATIGVALIGIGTAEGYSTGWTAGAIISGAYFGDKISPLSDTTVMASSSAGTKLFEHIRYMLFTTVPSIVIALVVFLVVSLTHESSLAAEESTIAAGLQSTFRITPWVLLVPVATGILIARKVPAIITLTCAILMAAVAALIFQPGLIWSIAQDAQPAAFGGHLHFPEAFRGTMISIYSSTGIDTGNEALNSLVETRGMNGMMSTVFLIICSVTFGGCLIGSGMMQSLTEALMKFIKGRTSLVGATVGTGIFANMITGDQYISIILTCSLFGKLYKSRGYEARLLSRSTEDSATITSVLIPWNSCGMTQSTVLKVPTLDYLPYCVFNYISPLMSILVAAIGWKIFRKEPEQALPADQ